MVTGSEMLNADWIEQKACGLLVLTKMIGFKGPRFLNKSILSEFE